MTVTAPTAVPDYLGERKRMAIQLTGFCRSLNFTSPRAKSILGTDTPDRVTSRSGSTHDHLRLDFSVLNLLTLMPNSKDRSCRDIGFASQR